MTHEKESIALAKQQLRQHLREIQRSLDSQWIAQASQSIQRRIKQLPEYQSAHAIMSYVSMGKEVATHQLLTAILEDGKIAVIPWCEGDDLRLFRFASFEELQPGPLGILEPQLELRSRGDKLFLPQDLDLILTPGLGFDRNGNRLGRGRGYYDRFLKIVPQDAVRVGLCFECQLVEAVPVSSNDEPMDLIITEYETYRPMQPRTRGKTVGDGLE